MKVSLEMVRNMVLENWFSKIIHFTLATLEMAILRDKDATNGVMEESMKVNGQKA